LVPISFRSRFTHPKAGVILISCASILVSFLIPGVTGHGQYFPGAPWHTLITSSNGWIAILSPLMVSFFLTTLVTILSQKRLRYREQMKAQLIATQDVLRQQQATTNGDCESMNSPPALILSDPAKS